MLKSKKKGFTLIELIVVIAILGILAAVLIPKFSGFTDKANKTEALVWAKQVATAYDSWYAENGNQWPATGDITTVTEEVATLSGVNKTSITLKTNGGLTVTDTKGNQASRADGDSKVTLVTP